MKGDKQEPRIQIKEERGELTLQGQCVLRWELSWPECLGEGMGAGRITAYYRRLARRWRSRWEREIYILACLDLAVCTSEGRPFRPWQAKLTTCITHMDDTILSLWQETEERWGFAYPLRHRMGDTWCIKDGAPRSLASFFMGRKKWKRELLEQVARQADERRASGTSLLDPDCGRRLKREFDCRRFYVTDRGVDVFFPMYALGAGAEGIAVFSIEVG